MIYSFLTVHRLTVSAMAVALARAVGVPSTAVDIADEDSVEDRDGRNWDALVLCGYHAVAGDVALAWEVSVADAVPDPPDEAEAARSLAALSGTTVLYPAEETVPSAYWAAAPDGTVTRARVVEAGASGGAVVVEVEAVETAVAQLPSARVQLLPEIFREEKVPTPVADAFAALTDADGSAPARSPENRAREELLLWERLVRRVEADWGPTGRYPEELYLEDLRTRDRLAERLSTEHGTLAGEIARSAETLDVLFRTHTTDDGGELLGRLTKAGSAMADRGWWWRRRPARLPWV
ncbi:hypothetical protein ABZY19_09735 [Streptomyces sp. NPDC006475]|uniref:hypothetical protein n=1 Tax=Streptomyces sp. NPDC006475 TaxID=3155719 RepID=UPI0033A72613